jgi:DNA-directed RNA polymerase subunit M/transcription elongation factor TFIIS
MSISVSCPSCGKLLKAPDSAAGKLAKCPNCEAKVRIPEVILEAEPVPLPSQEAEPESDDEFLSGIKGLKDHQFGEALPSRRPCPQCGEMIVATAAKCRYCGEIFDPKLKKKAKASRSSDDDDADMSTLDYVACVLCAGITCLIGIVYMIQGKRKGLKMVGVSLAAIVFWNIVNVIIQSALQQHGPR